MVGFIKWLTKELAAPSSFDGDPVGYAGNQCAHGWLGLTLTCYLIMTIMGTTGSYPNQTAMAAVSIATYAFLWEGLRWNGWDSVEDTLYFAIGASFFIFIDMQHVIVRLTILSICIDLFLLRGMYSRYKRAFKNG